MGLIQSFYLHNNFKRYKNGPSPRRFSSRWFVAERKKKDSELEAGIWIETKKAASQAAMLEGKLTPAGRRGWGPTEADLLAMHIFYSESIWGAALWLPQGSRAPARTKAPVSVKLSMSWHHPHCFRATQCSPLLTAVQSQELAGEEARRCLPFF